MLKSSCPGVFYKKDVLKNFEKFIGAVSFIKVTGSQPAALLKKRLQRRSFLVNLSIFLRTPSVADSVCFINMRHNASKNNSFIENGHPHSQT